MSDFEVHEASIRSLRRALDDGTTTCTELVEAYLTRIAAYDTDGPELTSIAYLNPDAAAEAASLDEELRKHGARGPLHGIPILVKDNYDVRGWPTRAGCLGLEGLVAERDATVVERLRAAGAMFLGKTNLHELAAGITTIASAHGQTRNPYDPACNPGGSSGGTSAAVAASLAAVGTGSDTCGSIRVPAAHCALYGLRPTQDRTPMEGIVPLSLTQDTLGPLARSVADLAIVLDVMLDPPAPTPSGSRSAPSASSFTDALEPNTLAGRRIGRLTTLFSNDPADQESCRVVTSALERMTTAGAEVVSVEIPMLSALLDENFIVILGEIVDDLAAYLQGHPSAPVQTLEALHATGTIHPAVAPVVAGALSAPIRQSEDYARAIANRERLQALLTEAMDAADVDALAYPSLLRTAVRLGEDQPGSNAHASADSGLPAITLPAGFGQETDLPVGLELLGRAHDDERLVALACAWEARELAVAPRRAPASTPPLTNGSAPTSMGPPGESR